jgi:IPT/TIG domain
MVTFGSTSIGGGVFQTRVTVLGGVMALGLASVVVTAPVAPGSVLAASTARPVVSSISAHDGSTGGDTRVTVHGAGFSHVLKVMFGSRPSPRVRVISPSELVATSPAGSARTVHIQVVTPAGRSTQTEASVFRFVPPPVVTTVMARHGVGTSFEVAVKGKYVSQVRKVLVDGRAASYREVGTVVMVSLPHRGPGSIDIQLVTAHGASTRTAADRFTYDRASAPVFTHSADTDADPAQALSALGCASSTWCLAGAGAGETEWNGTHWSVPQGLNSLSGIGLDDISCPSTSFCGAITDPCPGCGGVTDAGFATFDGSRWTTRNTTTFVDLGRVSCGSSDLCAVTGTSYANRFDPQPAVVLYQNGVVSSAHELPTGSGEVSVSCVTSAFCLAANGTDYQTYDGSSWSAAVAVPTSSAPVLSCGTPTFCVMIAGDGSIRYYDGASWSSPTSFNGGSHAIVSCASATLCAGTEAGGVAIYDGTDWSSPHDLGGTVGYISCTSPSLCLATTTSGQYATNDAGSWSTVATAVHPQGRPTSLDCPSTTSCVAVDATGSAFTYDGQDWTAPVTIDPAVTRFQITDPLVSCGSPTFCVAMSENLISTFDGHQWTPFTTSPAYPDDETWVTALSCASPSFCQASVGYYRTETFNGVTWKAGPSIPGAIESDADSGVTGLSCVSSAFCLATANGHGYQFNGQSWTLQTSTAGVCSGPCGAIESSGIGEAVSCATASLCAGGGYLQTNNPSGPTPVVSIYRGGRWTETELTGNGQVVAVSCPSSRFCAAATDTGEIYTYDGLTWSYANLSLGSVGTLSCANAQLCVTINSRGDTSVIRP